MKTKGKCLKCNAIFSSGKADAHLLHCVCQSHDDSSSVTEGYLIKALSEEEPNVYWMFFAISKDSPLKLLDEFLRQIWLECCGHLSEFTIGNRTIFSYTGSGYPTQAMKKQIGQVLSPGEQFGYVYDMGSSTNLVLQVIENVMISSQNQVLLLMRNKAPELPCESCKNLANIICSLCGKTTCDSCQDQHLCAVKEKDTYMLMPLVNSPRTGVCGYDGE